MQVCWVQLMMGQGKADKGSKVRRFLHAAWCQKTLISASFQLCCTGHVMSYKSPAWA